MATIGCRKILSSLFSFCFISGITFTGYSQCNEGDFAFMDSIRAFAFEETGIIIHKEFYRTASEDSTPYLYGYLSKKNKVERPEEFPKAFYSFGSNFEEAALKEKEAGKAGFDFFLYKTFGNSASQLNPGFCEYPDEAKSFIALHEFVHNWVDQENLSLPYPINEALGDLIGNQLTVLFFKTKKPFGLKEAILQVKLIETLGEEINHSREKINRRPGKREKTMLEFLAKINPWMEKANAFVRYRYAFAPSNGYFLKNSYYTRYYFLLKKVYEKTSTLKSFFDIIREMPLEERDAEEYLKSYL